jgi:hypothetical protein
VLWVDLDGVLADLDGMILRRFQTPLNRDRVEEAVALVERAGYLAVPWTPGGQALWRALQPYQPAVLTWVPSVRIAAQKAAWVLSHCGPGTRLVPVPQAEKACMALPGDILIDDQVKYRDGWTAKGGRFILHTSAAETLRQVQE